MKEYLTRLSILEDIIFSVKTDRFMEYPKNEDPTKIG